MDGMGAARLVNAYNRVLFCCHVAGEEVICILKAAVPTVLPPEVYDRGEGVLLVGAVINLPSLEGLLESSFIGCIAPCPWTGNLQGTQKT